MIHWKEVWSKKLFILYVVLSIIVLIEMTYFWIVGPIEMAQACSLILLWTVIGAFINSFYN